MCTSKVDILIWLLKNPILIFTSTWARTAEAPAVKKSFKSSQALAQTLGRDPRAL